jgi:hypothetical protein
MAIPIRATMWYNGKENPVSPPNRDLKIRDGFQVLNGTCRLDDQTAIKIAVGSQAG